MRMRCSNRHVWSVGTVVGSSFVAIDANGFADVSDEIGQRLLKIPTWEDVTPPAPKDVTPAVPVDVKPPKAVKPAKDSAE